MNNIDQSVCSGNLATESLIVKYLHGWLLWSENWSITEQWRFYQFPSAFSIFVQSGIIVMWLKDFRHFLIDWNDVRNGILTKEYISSF